MQELFQENSTIKISLSLSPVLELVREDCGGGPDFSLYQSWQWWISGLASTLTISLGSLGNLLSLLVLLQK
jgi:hypothetical protein